MGDAMKVGGYRDLFVWRESIAFVPDVYAVVSGFPVHERLALSAQIRRAAVSVPTNIAEGYARFYPREFLHHLGIARGRLAELHTLLVVAEQLGYIEPDVLVDLEHKIGSLARPINRLLTSVLKHLKGSESRSDSVPQVLRDISDDFE
jgi:four helix bundle protein